MTGHTPTIPPGRAPGLLVARTIDLVGDVVAEDILDLDGVQTIAERHADAAVVGGIEVVYIYDGDTGECVMTVWVDR